MPSRPLRPCASQPCPNLVEKGRCPAHERATDRRRRETETWRHVRGANGGTIDIYQSKDWKRLRAQVLREANYLCQCDECRGCRKCQAKPRMEADRFNLTCWKCEALLSPQPANTADHVTPVRDDVSRVFDRSNLRAMSEEHHSRKTIAEVRA